MSNEGKFLVGDKVCNSYDKALDEARILKVRIALGHTDGCRVVGVKTIVENIDALHEACKSSCDDLIKPLSE